MTNREHEILSKLRLGVPLSQKEESYYLLYLASCSERYIYLKKKKERLKK